MVYVEFLGEGVLLFRYGCVVRSYESQMIEFVYFVGVGRLGSWLLVFIYVFFFIVLVISYMIL